MQSFFTEFTAAKAAFYMTMLAYVSIAAIAVMAEPYLSLPCDEQVYNIEFPNVFYHHNPCTFDKRYWQLLGLKRIECVFGRHLVVSVILGSIIGYERRYVHIHNVHEMASCGPLLIAMNMFSVLFDRGPDRPAGIRTMALIALAACLFTINSIFALEVSPMSWDPARVSAALPSGVGFLGAALIVKDKKKDIDGEIQHFVKGINTAASVWLSAAVGAACGGGLYFVASFTTALMLNITKVWTENS
ncbi:hypothetical protein ACHAWO_006341 [Cyclotella atomus]|uniref:MgtC/SapB/SrpB/YhiD N-terminal domain-containing protein n=1 Tax=Cyclotella atomus TaxID=382360 RepID=A0ABD3NM85_9STRA